MSTQAELPKGHPMRDAWEAYRATEKYANSRHWALDPNHVDGSLWAAFIAGYAAAPPAEAPAVMDKGPWKIAAGSRDVYSGDFVADVALRISGDFEDEMHRIRYAEWLCETLNRAAAPAAPAPEYRAATPEEEAAIDAAVGLVKVVLRFPTLLHCTLTAEAEERGIALPALIREKLTAPRVTGGREVADE